MSNIRLRSQIHAGGSHSNPPVVSSNLAKHEEIWLFFDRFYLRFCPFAEKYGSEKTRILAYFAQGLVFLFYQVWYL